MASYSDLLSLVKEHLHKAEKIYHSVYGVFDGEFLGESLTREGILIANNKRLLLYGKRTFGHDLEALHFKHISSIEKSENFMGGIVTAHASGNNIKLKWIQQGDVNKLVNYVDSKINNTKPSNKETSEDIPTQIQKLADLKEKGILTENEFEKKKRELLDKM